MSSSISTRVIRPGCFGGTWEALVKSTKRAMAAMLVNVLTVDEVSLPYTK